MRKTAQCVSKLVLNSNTKMSDFDRINQNIKNKLTYLVKRVSKEYIHRCFDSLR
jgi:hypothetical protein